MSLTLEQLKQILGRLGDDPAWKEIDPSIQKDLLDELQESIAEGILNAHIQAVLPKKRSAARRKQKLVESPESL